MNIKKVFTIGVIVLVFIAAFGLSIAMKKSGADASEGTVFTIHDGVEITEKELKELVGDSFDEYPQVDVVVSAGKEARIIDTSDGSGALIIVPAASAFKGTDLENVALREGGVKGAQSSQILIMLAKRANGESAHIDFTQSIRDQYMTVVDEAMTKLGEGEGGENSLLFAALSLTYMQMELDGEKELTAMAIQGLIDNNENWFLHSESQLADRQHERETAAEVTEHSQDALVTTALGAMFFDILPMLAVVGGLGFLGFHIVKGDGVDDVEE